MDTQTAKALLELMVEYVDEKNAMAIRGAYGPDNVPDSLDDISARFAALLPNV